MKAISSQYVPFCDTCIYIKPTPPPPHHHPPDGISCVNLYTGVNIYDCATNLWNIFCNGKDDSSSKTKW